MHKKEVRTAFTLIELLVVVAIISILAAILFPVFARARENARRASCQSNLKQISLGLLQYTQDHDERFPMSHSGTASGAEARMPTAWANVIQPYLKSDQIFQCPSERYRGPGTIVTTDAYRGFSDYAANYYVMPGATATFNTVKLSQLQYPATTVIVTDGRDPNNYAYSYVYWISWVTGNGQALCSTVPGSAADPTIRHLEGSNWAFADGHVKWLKPGKVKDAWNDAGTQYICGVPSNVTAQTGTGASSPNGTDPTLCIG
jgi:prepilin-type N-terminal cleavage/methylation domain-containing protein/prepilin-type processing-associated H-X9-DG protein